LATIAEEGRSYSPTGTPWCKGTQYRKQLSVNGNRHPTAWSVV